MNAGKSLAESIEEATTAYYRDGAVPRPELRPMRGWSTHSSRPISQRTPETTAVHLTP